jgi:hypothetical protein
MRCTASSPASVPPRVLLWTAAPNPRAQRTFERLGFRITIGQYRFLLCRIKSNLAVSATAITAMTPA